MQTQIVGYSSSQINAHLIFSFISGKPEFNPKIFSGKKTFTKKCNPPD